MAVNNTKFSSNDLTIILERVSECNIQLDDIENAIGLFEKVSDALIQLNKPLSSLCSIENVTESSNECTLQNQLKRLRATSIDLLNCRKVIEKRRNSDGRKRASCETNPEIPVTKRARNSEQKQSLIKQGDGNELLDLCYICKRHGSPDIPKHEFYPWMCVECGNVNLIKRNQMGDLNGKVALVTGGRIKIGFEIALKLLRCGATVIITTRFPNDARRRYEKQNDFSQWSNRFHIFKLDLRFIPHVDKFCHIFSMQFPRLDILIQNAAQTIRRPAVYYQSLIDGEREGMFCITSSNNNITNYTDVKSMMELTNTSELLIHPEDFQYSNNAQLSSQHFPLNAIDDDGNQIDLRPQNSWITNLNEVETQEMVEVTLANYMSPFVILNKLTPIMENGNNSRSDFAFIVLVSAMEGKFSECKKTGKHPHTNAAKAALNMLVKTSARHYKKMGILMNAVDTGWVTDEHPIGYKSKLVDGLKTPLDSIDGAARVLDPIFKTVNNRKECPVYGKFLKDYRVVGW